jgi:hypothetical protein
MNQFDKKQKKMIDENISLCSHRMFYPASEDDEEPDEVLEELEADEDFLS